MALDPKIIKSSFENVKPIAMEAMTYFYDFMFKKYPAAEGFFKDVNMEEQKKALAGGLSYIVEHLEESDRLVGYLKGLGVRHMNYGVEDAHYAIVGDCLLETFAHFFGAQWTPELKAQWTEAYGVISSVMMEAARAKKAA